MKRSFLLVLLFTFHLYAKLPLIASILPEKSFIEAIGGEEVAVSLMVKPGNSPHTYEPKPSQMKDISHAALYLAIGVEFEHTWLQKFADINPDMKIIDLSRGIRKYPITGDTSTQGEELDPHIWTSPANVRIIARNILDALIEADSAHEAVYTKNYQQFTAEIDRTDRQIRSLLSSLPKERKSFIVFHPAWGYFARTYGLRQIPIEIGGKSPKPRAVQALITEARARHIRTVLTAPEFSDAVAKQIAHTLHIRVLKISPMAPNWSENLLRLAETIANTATLTK